MLQIELFYQFNSYIGLTMRVLFISLMIGQVIVLVIFHQTDKSNVANQIAHLIKWTLLDG